MRRDATLLARWSDHLIERVASGQFVLVVGAGVSRSCTNSKGSAPPSWPDLLDKLMKALCSQRERVKASEAIAHGDYLLAAELIRSAVRAKGREHDYLKLIADATDGGTKAEDQFQPSDLHNTIMRLNPEIIVTTNYDRILERASNSGYNIHSFDSANLGSDLRQGTPVLVKIHGTVDKSPDLVLTRSDYSRLRRDGARTLNVLQALFLTRTVLFVGYGFSDPDIHLVMENVLGATDDAPSHYLLAAEGIPAHVRDVYRYAYGTTVVGYKDGDFEEMYRMMELLADAVDAKRSMA